MRESRQGLYDGGPSDQRRLSLSGREWSLGHCPAAAIRENYAARRAGGNSPAIGAVPCQTPESRTAPPPVRAPLRGALVPSLAGKNPYSDRWPSWSLGVPVRPVEAPHPYPSLRGAARGTCGENTIVTWRDLIEVIGDLWRRSARFPVRNPGGTADRGRRPRRRATPTSPWHRSCTTPPRPRQSPATKSVYPPYL